MPRKPKGGEISLSTPWASSDFEAKLKDCRLLLNDSHFMTDKSSEALEVFIMERTALHRAYIHEQERTKRLALILATILILSAAAALVFAPVGRERLSYWIGAALVIFAAGAVGYQRIWGKSKNLSFGADRDRRDL